MKNRLGLTILIGYCQLHRLFNINKLKKRIKTNEGFRNEPYLDQLGNLTTGYGHLIRKSEKQTLSKKIPHTFLNNLFNKDFNRAVSNFEANYKKYKYSKKINEILIEMIFQLGIKKTKKFKKFNYFLKCGQHHMAALEMMSSLWYAQTPKRVDQHISRLLGFNNVKRR